jgi:hypothetical protein
VQLSAAVGGYKIDVQLSAAVARVPSKCAGFLGYEVDG